MGAVAVALLPCLSAGSVALAQTVTTVRTDATLGKTAVTIDAAQSNVVAGKSFAVSGRVYPIPEELGKLAGSNLFHSFEHFSVGAGDAAVFWTTTPGVTNVISRVTGSAASQIDGLLALQAAPGSRPNLYFLNPNGVLFGVSSRIDVPAEFHVSTAHHMKFDDGAVFAADGTQSRFTTAAPEAFGFLGGNGAIRFNNVVAEGRVQPT